MQLTRGPSCSNVGCCYPLHKSLSSGSITETYNTTYIQWIEIYPLDRIALSSFEKLSPGLVLVNKATISLASY